MFSVSSDGIKNTNKRELVSGAAAPATTNPSFLELTLKEERLIDELWEKLNQFGFVNPHSEYWIGGNKSVATTVFDNNDRGLTGTTTYYPQVTFNQTRSSIIQKWSRVRSRGVRKRRHEEIGPKIMKSMFLHAASKCNNDESVIRLLKVVGFSQFDLRMKILVMDNPDGYVCRIRTIPQYEISTTPFHMTSGLLPILKPTLKSKLTVQPSIKLVHEYLNVVQNEETRCEKQRLVEENYSIKEKEVSEKKPTFQPLSSTSTNISPTTNTSLDDNNATTHPAINNNNTATTPSTSSNSNSNIDSSSSLGKRSRSSSAKTNSYKLTQDMKEEYKRSFEALNDEKKWVLDDGTKVEDLMCEYGAQCTHEQIILSSPVHSFMLDVEDKCWKSIFIKSQLQELKSTGEKAFGDYNDSCKNMFSVFSDGIKNTNKRELVSGAAAAATTNPSFLELTLKEEHVIDELWEKLTQFGFINRHKNYDLHWMQKTMDDILDLYRFRILDWVKKNGSEMDFVTRVWIMLDEVFDDLIIETRRDNKSVATTVFDNKDRGVTGTTTIVPKLPSIRPNLASFKNGVEYGVAECGKGDDEEIGKNEIIAV
ncbi:hypothetical protein INT45_004617 [Circinella minor]|uniref:Uncharacterized protein n=1 Tax=Circinella minor TaxID=1195481 RepID=A0A8H7S2J0_9FUNG|nr:hypothetical protein INT45_004617 [Circinella minor]